MKQQIEQLFKAIAETKFHDLEDDNPVSMCRRCKKYVERTGLASSSDCEMPILIGDVLERIAEISQTSLLSASLIDLGQRWQPCGFTKSLQEIFDCEWGKRYPKLSGGRTMSAVLIPKDPAVKTLGEFLLSVGVCK